MAQRFNLFDPNLLLQNFLGGIAGNPSELTPPPVIGGVGGNPSEDAPDPTSGYVPLPPVILGGVDGSDPVRSGVPQNIADFYGGILNIGQPDAGYFDEFRLPGDDRVIESGTNLTVATPTDVVDTRVPYDPDYYKEIAQALIDEMQPVETPVFEEAVVNDPSVFVADSTPNFLPFDDSYILDQLQSLQDQQQSFLPSEPVFAPTYDDTVLRQQMDDFQKQLTNLPAVDTSQFITAQDLPTYQQFDPTGLQQQIDAFQQAPAVDTSQFLTAADLPTYDTSALENEIAELRAQLNRNTTPTPALTTPTFDGILPNFGGFNVR